LTAATLVLAIVIVLWGIKIFYSAWTGRQLASNKRPPAKKRFATKASLPRRRRPSVSVAEEFAAYSSFQRIELTNHFAIPADYFEANLPAFPW